MDRVNAVLCVAACMMSGKAFATFLPPNNLNLQDHVGFVANITEQEFNDIINSVVDTYKPIVAPHGGHLQSNNL